MALAASWWPTPVYAAKANKPKPLSCEQRVAVVNQRSTVLAAYRKSENNEYKLLRKQWVARIAYAGQWVPSEATKLRELLYIYDKLHAETINELDKQIVTYYPLKRQPLDCSAAKQKALAKTEASILGVQKGKVTGGNALISQYKQAETKFLKDKFKPAGKKMINRLHKEKAEDLKPRHPRLSIT